MSYTNGAPEPRPDGYCEVLPGDPAPNFEQAASGDQRLTLEGCAGRYLVLCFFVSAGDARGQRALAFAASHEQLLANAQVAFYGVSIDWRDQAEARVSEAAGRHFFWDFDLKISRRYGAVPVAAVPGAISARRMWFILDPTLRVRAVVRFERDGSDQPRVLQLLRNLPPPERCSGAEIAAPVLYLPRIFEPELCARLVAMHQRAGGQETGVLREIAGASVLVHDHAHKRRNDLLIEDPNSIAELQARVLRRVVPEIAHAYQFQVTRMERFLIGCYRAEHGGHFRAHRDNTTTRSAHRRFALSINLNDDYEGGEISFPEYGPRRYRPPLGGGAVFSCSLLHAVSAVTRGNRYAFLPFLHDEAAERVLQQNNSTSPGP